nr:uncharacterized protein LOC113807047 [Penaeus vannamei]
MALKALSHHLLLFVLALAATRPWPPRTSKPITPPRTSWPITPRSQLATMASCPHRPGTGPGSDRRRRGSPGGGHWRGRGIRGADRVRLRPRPLRLRESLQRPQQPEGSCQKIPVNSLYTFYL